MKWCHHGKAFRVALFGLFKQSGEQKEILGGLKGKLSMAKR